jgi:hypothetical protein
VSATYYRNSQDAYEDALEADFLNLDESSDRYVEDYVYMHSVPTGDLFKHIRTDTQILHQCNSYERETELRGYSPGYPRSITKMAPESYQGLIDESVITSSVNYYERCHLGPWPYMSKKIFTD